MFPAFISSSLEAAPLLIINGQNAFDLNNLAGYILDTVRTAPKLVLQQPHAIPAVRVRVRGRGFSFNK